VPYTIPIPLWQNADASNANFAFLHKQNEQLAAKIDTLNKLLVEHDARITVATAKCESSSIELKSTGEKILSTQTLLTKIAARVEAILAYLPLFVRKLSEWFVKGAADGGMPALLDV
jgi:hypothetical protein